MSGARGNKLYRVYSLSFTTPAVGGRARVGRRLWVRGDGSWLTCRENYAVNLSWSPYMSRRRCQVANTVVDRRSDIGRGRRRRGPVPYWIAYPATVRCVQAMLSMPEAWSFGIRYQRYDYKMNEWCWSSDVNVTSKELWWETSRRFISHRSVQEDYYYLFCSTISNQIKFICEHKILKKNSWKKHEVNTKKSADYRLWVLTKLKGREAVLTWAIKFLYPHRWLCTGCIKQSRVICVSSSVWLLSAFERTLNYCITHHVMLYLISHQKLADSQITNAHNGAKLFLVSFCISIWNKLEQSVDYPSTAWGQTEKNGTIYAHLSVMGSLVIVLLQIFSWLWEWNNFENQLIFGKVKVYKTMVPIFGHPV